MAGVLLRCGLYWVYSHAYVCCYPLVRHVVEGFLTCRGGVPVAQVHLLCCAVKFGVAVPHVCMCGSAVRGICVRGFAF